MRAYDAVAPEPEPPVSPAASAGFLVWHVSHRWQSLLAERLVPLALTPAQFVVLGAVSWLTRAPGGPAPIQREVAAQAGTDPMMTSQILRTLERRRLVQRAGDEADGRVFRVAVTPAGRDLALRGVRVVHAADAEFFGALAARDAFVATLRDLARSAGVAESVVAVPPARSSAQTSRARKQGKERSR